MLPKVVCNGTDSNDTWTILTATNSSRYLTNRTFFVPIQAARSIQADVTGIETFRYEVKKSLTGLLLFGQPLGPPNAPDQFTDS